MTINGSRCALHEVSERRHYDQYKRDKQAKRFYNSKVWRQTRAAKLAKDRLCQMDCEREHRKTIATTVHHKDKNIWNIDDDNLQSACAACHSKHETLSRGGFAPRFA
jgi:5-methylcytosine-specific restriction enzyme A